MNLSQQTLRNMTTEELLSAAESVESIDRLTFSYISQKVQEDLEDVQDELNQAVESLEEVEDNLDKAGKAFSNIEESLSDIIEEYPCDDKLKKLLKEVRLIAESNADEFGGWL